MDTEQAILALAALGQPTRLAAFRLLVRAGSAGLGAGAIAAALNAPANTMSTHLAILTRAELVASTREGRAVIYRVRSEGISALLAYLVADCCDGRPELCAPWLGGNSSLDAVDVTAGCAGGSPCVTGPEACVGAAP